MKLTSLFEDIVCRKGKVLVIGLGITGIETALFLHERGVQPVCAESKTWDEYKASSKYMAGCEKLKSLDIALHFGIDAMNIRRLLKETSLCVVSPGVPLSHPLIMEVQKKRVRITSEFELGVELAGLPAIVVTGSNGKSTTVTLIHQLLMAGGKKSFLCGNIGSPVVSQLSDILKSKDASSSGERYLVVEASSYQLEGCEGLKPRMSVFLNLSNNHLERHGTMEAYFEAKRNAFVCLDRDDVAIINTDDPYGARLAEGLHARLFAFGFRESGDSEEYGLIHYDKSADIDRVQLYFEGREESYDLGSSQLIGRHTRYNVCAAIAAARLLGVPGDAVQRVISDFCPLPHRIEPVLEKGEVLFINDSKSTTVASTCAALNTVLEYFPSREIVLLVGGLAKKASWEPLLRILRESQERIRGVICFGKDGGMLKRELKRVKVDAVECPNLKSAVEKAGAFAQLGDIVLLSPGCASFDEFKDYEERGNTFKKLVAGA